VGGEHSKTFPLTVCSNLALGRPPLQQQLVRNEGLEVRHKKFAGVIAGRGSAAQEETKEKC